MVPSLYEPLKFYCICMYLFLAGSSPVRRRQIWRKYWTVDVKQEHNNNKRMVDVICPLGCCCIVVLLFYVHGKDLRSCRDGQLA